MSVRHLKAVCPHDCPDTCVMTVDVEGDRAVALGGDPEHPFTRGFLCAKVGRYLERVYSPERTLQDCMKIMSEKNFRHLPVVDNGRLAGIISVSDIVKWLAGY